MTTTESIGVNNDDSRPRRGRNPEGRMPLADHLRELRGRLVKSLIAVAIGTVIGWHYYHQIFDFLAAPINDVVAQAQAQGRDVRLTINDVAGAFTLQIKVAAMFGFIVACPVWIYQLWRFITPGLRKNERRWALAFAAVAVPLFLGGVALAYALFPAALQIMLGFTPDEVANYLPVDTYLSFFARMVFVFGLAFLTPLILVALNIFGVLSGKTLASWWRPIVFGVFVFAAIATPTGDPINMTLLALPVLALVGAALGFCFLNDRRRARNSSEPDYSSWADDEISPL